MSETSELLKEYLDKSQDRMHLRMFGVHTGEEHEHEPMHELRELVDAHEVFDPTFPAHLVTYNQRSLQMIRRAFRELAGKDLWPDAFTAVSDVMDCLMPRLAGVPLQALADGYQLTCSDPSFAVKKYTRMGKLEEIYNSDVFNQASELIAMEYLADEDCVDLVKSIVLATVIGLGNITGYKDYTGQGLYHVWDLVLLSCRSICTTFYLAGREMGEHVADEDALAGILAATEQQEN